MRKGVVILSLVVAFAVSVIEAQDGDNGNGFVDRIENADIQGIFRLGNQLRRLFDMFFGGNDGDEDDESGEDDENGEDDESGEESESGEEGESGEGGERGEDGRARDQCTGYVISGGRRGIGCVDNGCCQYNLQIGSLCPGSKVCCFTSDTCSDTGSSSDYNCYGDVKKLRPTGASSRTASQDGINYSGVAASNQLVDNDLAELNKRKDCYVEAGKNNCVHPAVIAAIASRESRGGKLLYRTGGWGDRGRAWGIMQCDLRASGLGDQCTQYGWDSCEHIDFMTKTILVPYIKQVKAKHPSWTPEQQLQGAVAAYNFGVGNVQSWSRLDIGTTGNDYSNDVIARAQRLINAHGW